MVRRFILTLALSSIFSQSIYADVVKEKKLNFKVKAESLKSDIHYSFAQGVAEELQTNLPEIAKLDSLGFLSNRNSSVIVSKVAYVVEKPIGFFDHENLVDEKLVSKLLGDQKIKKTSPDTFVVVIPGKKLVTYKLRVFIDSDDVSTLPQAKVTESVTAFKKLDVISQSAPAISFREMSEFSSYAWGSVVVSSYIPLKENQTLIISYYMTSLKEKGDVKKNEENIKEEFISTQQIMSKLN